MSSGYHIAPLNHATKFEYTQRTFSTGYGENVPKEIEP